MDQQLLTPDVDEDQAHDIAEVEGDPQPVTAGRLPRLRFRRIVAGAPIVGFTGVNGAGKSLLMHSENIADLAEGRRVISTTPIVSPWGNSEPLLSLRQLLELRDCTVAIDEVAAVFSSRGTQSLPDEVSTFLQSMRHQKVTLRWAAPAWARADKQLREVTQVCVNVLPMVKYRVPGEFWPKARFILAGALDCTTVGVDNVPEKVIARRIYLPKKLPAFGRYDHEADVSRIGWERRSGQCVDCGGTIPAERCTPDRHLALGIDLRVSR